MSMHEILQLAYHEALTHYYSWVERCKQCQKNQISAKMRDSWYDKTEEIKKLLKAYEE